MFDKSDNLGSLSKPKPTASNIGTAYDKVANAPSPEAIAGPRVLMFSTIEKTKGLITSKVLLTAFFTLSRFSAIDPSPLACMALSIPSTILAKFLDTAVCIFLKDVAIPFELILASSANPFKPSLSSIILSPNSSKVNSPLCRAAYKSFCADAPANPKASAVFCKPTGIVS